MSFDDKEWLELKRREAFSDFATWFQIILMVGLIIWLVTT